MASTHHGRKKLAHDAIWVLRRQLYLVATVWTTVGILKPPRQAVVPKNMFAFWQPQRVLINSLGGFHAVVVVANNASYAPR
jgi:hypothetical protein